MHLVQWTPAMSVGVPELDDDHKLLIRVINQLAMHAEKGSHPAVLRQCLYAVMRFAEYHFGREEDVMFACGFPGLATHRDEHRRFAERIRALAQTFESTEGAASAAVPMTGSRSDGDCEPISRELLALLRDWLDHHILNDDLAYRPFVENLPDTKKGIKRVKATKEALSQ